MKYIIHVILVLFLVIIGASCSRWKSDADSAAEKYYVFLMEEQCDKFVEGIAYCDSMPQGYKEQMCDLVSQYIEREKKAHGGFVAARAVESQEDGDFARVFLEVVFSDSTKENIVLPMVKCGSVWKMQ